MNVSKKRIVEILDTLEGNINFFSQGTQDFILPGIMVDNVPLAFPVVAENIENIIAKAHLAPFGKGLENIVDQKV